MIYLDVNEIEVSAFYLHETEGRQFKNTENSFDHSTYREERINKGIDREINKGID